MEAEVEHVGAGVGVAVGQPGRGVARLGVAGRPRLPRLDVGPLAVEKPQPGGDVFIALLVKLLGRRRGGGKNARRGDPRRAAARRRGPGRRGGRRRTAAGNRGGVALGLGSTPRGCIRGVVALTAPPPSPAQTAAAAAALSKSAGKTANARPTRWAPVGQLPVAKVQRRLDAHLVWLPAVLVDHFEAFFLVSPAPQDSLRPSDVSADLQSKLAARRASGSRPHFWAIAVACPSIRGQIFFE